MSINIASIQVGSVVTEGDPSTKDPMLREWTTAFYKHPIDPPKRTIELRELGLAGDAVADTKHHGGADKAVLCYAQSHYSGWSEKHPTLEFSAGGFGENLSLDGCDESSICIGDAFRIGDCEIEVSQPRQPCWKIARRWGVKTLTKEVAQTGHTGWYIRVLAPGEIQTGMELELLRRPHPDWTIARANDVMFGRLSDRMAVFELMNLPELAEAWRADIA